MVYTEDIEIQVQLIGNRLIMSSQVSDSFKPAALSYVEANLFSKPRSRVREHKNLGLGDLHGNALKLLHFLVQNSIVEISKDDYKDFVRVYRCKNPNSKKKLTIAKQKELMDKLIGQLTLKENNIPLLRLIGDELADRGQNDYFTLKLLQKIDSLGVPVEIYQSNHTLEFSLAYERATREVRKLKNAYREAKKAYEDAEHSRKYGSQEDESQEDEIGRLKQEYERAKEAFNQGSQNLHLDAEAFNHNGQANSIIKFNQYLDEGLLTASELDDLVSVHENHQRLLGYSLTDNGITFYSHAPMDVSLIKPLADRLNVDYDDTTNEKLAETIDSINEAYSRHVRDGTLGTLVNRDIMNVFARKKILNPEVNGSLEHLFWNRNYEDLSTDKEHQGYSISFVHGHTPTEYRANYTNLDSLFGKFPQYFETSLYGSEEVENPVYKDDGRLTENAYKQHLDHASEQVQLHGLQQEIQSAREKVESLKKTHQKLMSVCATYSEHLHKNGGSTARRDLINSLMLTLLENDKIYSRKSLSSESLTFGQQLKKYNELASTLERQIEAFSGVLKNPENKTVLEENSKPCRAFFRGVGVALAKSITVGRAFESQSVFFRSHGRKARDEMGEILDKGGFKPEQ